MTIFNGSVSLTGLPPAGREDMSGRNELESRADCQWHTTSNSSSDGSGLPNQSQAVAVASLVTILDYPAVTEVYIFICCLVWLLCVVGNCMVLTVMTRSPSMRTRTNLFLCHLAVADLSVGLVCMIPNMVMAAKIFYWFPDPAGRILCKVYNFFEEFSLTASVLLLVLIAAERYVAIIYPLRARQLFTRCRMYTSLALVWLAAVLYNVPLLMIYETATIEDGHTYCYRYDTDEQPIRMDVYHVCTFILTYLLPLLLMGTMYLRVALTLWKSSPVNLLQVTDRAEGSGTGRTTPAGGLEGRRTDHESKNKDVESRNSSITSHTSHTSCSSSSVSKAHKPGADPNGAEPCGAVPDVNRPLLLACRAEAAQELNATTAASSFPARGPEPVRCLVHPKRGVPSSSATPLNPSTPAVSGGVARLPGINTGRMRDGVYAIRSGVAASTAPTCRYQVTAHRVLQARRKVIRLLLAVLLVFACCVLPFHVRLLLRYGLRVQLVHTPVGILDFVSQLLFFLNSALNPVLYSLMSYSFRRSARQVFCCDSRSHR